MLTTIVILSHGRRCLERITETIITSGSWRLVDYIHLVPQTFYHSPPVHRAVYSRGAGTRSVIAVNSSTVERS
ncbi:hypothetical protein WN55_03763 [Dufourea novaeangliae]|uniref:Uncharacterized protein n=1 Tax=Dufourea novaeangliae TaxID=178035 RepID=A0A154PK59_DUFNO|nr:hypothetical protein WN55_03763 [Dufourea novaeangliae]